MLTVKEIVASAKDWKVLSERQARETRRTVFLVDDRYVVKKFTLPRSTRSYRRPWITEDKGLRRLHGDGAPLSYGFMETQSNGDREAWLAKQYLTGATMTAFTDSDIPSVAQLMARLHHHMIITDDANVGNFLKREDGQMMFLDLGRARVFIWRSPWLYMNIGWELAKLRREGFNWKFSHWIEFSKLYFSELACSRPTRSLIKLSCITAIGLRMARKRLQGKSSWS